jgi:hypothetical protein
MVLTRGGFTQVVGDAFAGLGFPAEGPTVYEFPIEMFLQDSDLTPINENIDKVVYGLTKWEPEVTEKGVQVPPKVTVTGKDYHEAVTNMSDLFLRNMWGDGLSITPPTEECVNWILTGTDLPRDTVVAGVAPRGRIATVETTAIALAMAGGRPEYLPVLIGAVEAITEPAWRLEKMSPNTGGAFPAVVVNGPIAKEIRLSSGLGLLGPDPVYPAGGSIGRALRIIMQDVGGATPGVGTMDIFALGRHINAVFAEDEAGLPPGWQSLSEERGFRKDTNVVSAFAARGGLTSRVKGMKSETKKEALELVLAGHAHMGRAMVSITDDQSLDCTRGGVSMLTPLFVGQLADEGYSKLLVKTLIWNNSKYPWSLMEALNLTDSVKAAGYPVGQDVPLVPKPEQVIIVVCGGQVSDKSFWFWCGGGTADMMVSKEMKLPAKDEWDALLKQAEEDLGPLPAA